MKDEKNKKYKYGFKSLKTMQARINRANFFYDYQKLEMVVNETEKLVSFKVDGKQVHETGLKGNSINMSKDLYQLTDSPVLKVNGEKIGIREFHVIRKAKRKELIEQGTITRKTRYANLKLIDEIVC